MRFAALLLPAIALAQASFKGRLDTAASVVPSSFRVRLNGGEAEAFIRADGRFAFNNVEAGLHELSIVDPFHVYPRYLVDIDSGTLKPRFYEIPNPAAPTVRRELPNGLVVRPLGVQDYFEKRQQMSILSLFMNPMVLIMGFTLLMGFAMPKLMEVSNVCLRIARARVCVCAKRGPNAPRPQSLDPKELEEMQRMQAKSHGDPSKMLAGLMSGKSEDDEEAEEEDAAPQ